MLSVGHSSSALFRVRRTVAAAGVAGVVLFAGAACGGSDGDSDMPGGMGHAGEPAASAMSSMPMAGTSLPGGSAGMEAMFSGDGLSSEVNGLRFTPATATLPANQASGFRFQIVATGGTPVTSFALDQTKLMHFYLIRSDLTGFQHVHPTMAPDGTWTANLHGTPAGSYRAYASFTARVSGRDVPLVLSVPVTVPGTATTVPLPAPATVTTVDGYTLTVSGDRPMGGMTHLLTVTATKDGKPVTDLQPYLDTYAHLTAFHAGNLAFAHLHPQGTVNGDHGGPALSFEATLPQSGSWRLFLQFQTAGTLHTAELTLAVA